MLESSVQGENELTVSVSSAIRKFGRRALAPNGLDCWLADVQRLSQESHQSDRCSAHYGCTCPTECFHPCGINAVPHDLSVAG